MQPIALTPYEGKEPYIFVSYAHKDSGIVYPILEELNRRGYRIWYDEGIAPGNEWPEEIAQHLDGCHLTISMISGRYIESDNCRRELTFALSKKKSFLAVFLEPTELSLGLEMQLSAQLCVLKYQYPSDETFLRKLCSSHEMTVCRGDAAEQFQFADGERLGDKDRFVASARPSATVKTETQPAKKSKWLLGILATVLLLVSGLTAIVLPELINSQQEPSSSQQSVDGVNQEKLAGPIVMGDETNLEYHLDGVGDLMVVTISGVWGEQKNSLGNLVIPENLNGYPVTMIDQYAFNACLGLKGIALPESVTKIKQFAFNGCANLEHVTLPANITEIPDGLFHGCLNLKEVDLPDNVVYVGGKAFKGSGLQTIVLPDTVCSVEATAFSGCTDLEQIVLSDSLYNIGDSAFENCAALKDVVLPSSLTAINYRTFYGCANLESIRIPRSVASIGNEAFYGCESLMDIYYEGSEAEWKKLMSKIDFNYPDTTPLLNNMALQKAEVHFNS